MTSQDDNEIPATANNTPVNSQTDPDPEPVLAAAVDRRAIQRAYDQGTQEGVMAGFVTGAVAAAVLLGAVYFVYKRLGQQSEDDE